MEISEEHVAAIARAFDIDPMDVRADTPLEVIGWAGTATDWLVAADHLDVALDRDPPDTAVVATIADVVAIVASSGGLRGERAR